MMSEIIHAGQDAQGAQAGDLIFCHRRGFSSAAIRWGERLRFRGGAHWSHVAVCVSSTEIVEALTHGVARNPLSVYHDIEYVLVRTGLEGQDQAQALAFVESCVGQRYGFLTDFGIALRFLTPGRGLWFGMNGTEICSGLAAQTLCRGWYIFSGNPASLSPAELAEDLRVSNPK